MNCRGKKHRDTAKNVGVGFPRMIVTEMGKIRTAKDGTGEEKGLVDNNRKRGEQQRLNKIGGDKDKGLNEWELDFLIFFFSFPHMLKLYS